MLHALITIGFGFHGGLPSLVNNRADKYLDSAFVNNGSEINRTVMQIRSHVRDINILIRSNVTLNPSAFTGSPEF